MKTCFVKEIISAKDKSLSVFENNVDDRPFMKYDVIIIELFQKF